MLRDHYEPDDLFAKVPELALKLDPTLAQLDTLLDDDALFNTIKADLQTRYPQTPTRGRPSTPMAVILRMLVLKHLQNWSYEELEHFVADSLVLRQFCRVYLNRVPDDTVLIRWANTIQPETLHQLHERVVQLARSVNVTRARKLRVDSTVVETDRHPPSDSSLLAVVGDRGCWSAENERYAKQQGVKQIGLPKSGKTSEARVKREQARWFKRLPRFRAGIEGRISVLKRKHGLRRCRDHGEAGFARWVGWGIIAGNLTVMARTMAARG
ncbi:MAG: transposase [Candidatus Bipolaricaulia bacterium]